MAVRNRKQLMRKKKSLSKQLRRLVRRLKKKSFRFS